MSSTRILQIHFF